ncbi:MAG: CotH kinase family protein [Cyclobacteriaceae bacterium]|nr:CotH kinase family protein [Cyclobacteriaceae bacterium]
MIRFYKSKGWKYILVIIFSGVTYLSLAQVNHWETAIFPHDTCTYHVGNTAPDSNWRLQGFDDSGWQRGPGGCGYGDGDDGTLISATLSVYVRYRFAVSDMTLITQAVLHADYDDGFVAYLNGVEIARANIGARGIEPPFNQPSDGGHEAVMYQGILPEEFVIDSLLLSNTLTTGENVLAIQVHNQSITSSDLSGNFYLSVGLSDAGKYYQDVPGWFKPPVIFTSSNLPLVFINTFGRFIQDDIRIAAQMGIVDNKDLGRNYLTDSLNNYDGRIEVEYRGSSSSGFPKRSMRLETQDSLANNRNVGLMGLPPENDWVLYAPYTDKSLMRNILAYKMGEWTGHYAPRTKLCELMLNGSYEGIYVLTETIKRDSNRLDIAELRPQDISGDQLTGGYIFKFDRVDYLGSWKSRYLEIPGWIFWTAYQLVYPKPALMRPEQFNYIKDYVHEFETAVKEGDLEGPGSRYGQLVDEMSFVDFFIVNEVSKNVDGYRLSTYFYKEKISKGGKLHAGPLWDFNLGFGNADYCEGNLTTGWAYRFNSVCEAGVPFYWEKIRGSERFVSLLKDRWKELRQGKFHTDSLMSYIDSVANVLGEAQERNFKKWAVLGTYVWPNAYVGNTYQDEVNYLKRWLRLRLDFLDREIEKMEPVYDYQALVNFTPQIYPNPFTETIRIKFALTRTSNVYMDVYNALGQRVYATGLGTHKTGYNEVSWEGNNDFGHPVPPGTYFIRLMKDDSRIASARVVKN